MKISFSLCLAGIGGLMLLAGCSKGSGENIIPPPEPNPTPDPEERMEIRINPSPGHTKANDFGFETGDCIGLYVVNYNGDTPGLLSDSGNHVDNMRFTYSGTWTPDSKIYWEDDATHADFYLVYPYSTVSSVSSMSFSAAADQSEEASYKSSDLMIGKTLDVAPSEEAVSITANHILSLVTISLKAGNGFTPESLESSDVSVRINGLLTQANVDIAAASITASGQPSEVTPLLQNGTYKALIVPQTVEESDLITVTADGDKYNFKTGLTFESGKSYNFNITVSKTSAGINVSIGPWENDGEDYGGTAE